MSMFTSQHHHDHKMISCGDLPALQLEPGQPNSFFGLARGEGSRLQEDKHLKMGCAKKDGDTRIMGTLKSCSISHVSYRPYQDFFCVRPNRRMWSPGWWALVLRQSGFSAPDGVLPHHLHMCFYHFVLGSFKGSRHITTDINSYKKRGYNLLMNMIQSGTQQSILAQIIVLKPKYWTLRLPQWQCMKFEQK